MQRPPLAFMSYVRMDDAHEDGRLSQIRERLSGEVRLQTGEAFEIFQDRKDIHWGQAWKQRIDDSLDAVTFLIPVITPGFFKSGPCRDELQRFLDRERQLGRTDLVLPIYYVAARVLEDEALRAKDPLAAIIAERQLADWRELRFEPMTSPVVGRRMADMARHVVDALERVDVLPATTSAPTLPKATAAVPTASGSQAAPVRSGPPAKTQPPILVVDALHRGDHASLGEALKAARPGTRILVRPGLYLEGLVVDKPVEIIGDGEPGEVIVEAKGADVVLFKTTMGRIANLTLRQRGDGQWYGVDIAQGRLELEDCDISSASLACVAIHGEADPRLRRNRIRDGQSAGVYVYERGQGTLEDNDIFANAKTGVSILSGGNPTLRRNRIHHGGASGVFVYEGGLGVLEDNDIFANTLSGVEIRDASRPTLRRNRIHDGFGGGILVHQKAEGLLEANEITANALAGVSISTEANPTLRHNRIHGGRASGVFVYEHGLGLLEDNEIEANASSGVHVQEGGRPVLRGNRVTANGRVGIRVAADGAGRYENNDLRGNTKGAWDLAPEAEAKVQRSGNLES